MPTGGPLKPIRDVEIAKGVFEYVPKALSEMQEVTDGAWVHTFSAKGSGLWNSLY